MTKEEVLTELQGYASDSAKKVLMNHGAREPFWGVKIGDMKKIVKKVKKNYTLALELYETGISDAMYLAGLIADEKKMTKADLKKWAKGAYWYMLSEYTVPWIAAESNFGMELALEWIESKEEMIASAGWSTLSSLVSIKADKDLDTQMLYHLLERAEKDIHNAPNRVRYTMNGFIIAAGCFVAELTEKATEVAKKAGKVSVNMGAAACNVPPAVEYIQKVAGMGRIGQKKKMARC